MKTKPRAGRLDKYIGLKLKEIRISKSLSQTDIAQVIDMTFQQIQKYENGQNRISAANLYKLCEYMGVSMKRFFP